MNWKKILKWTGIAIGAALVVNIVANYALSYFGNSGNTTAGNLAGRVLDPLQTNAS